MSPEVCSWANSIYLASIHKYYVKKTWNHYMDLFPLTIVSQNWGWKNSIQRELFLIQFSWDKLHWPQNYGFLDDEKKSRKRDPMILIEFQMVRPNETKIISIHKKSIGIWLQFSIYVSIFKPLVFYFIIFFLFSWIYSRKKFVHVKGIR